jgi:septal ring factor EnvC (AmiA/AmiB activator)
MEGTPPERGPAAADAAPNPHERIDGLRSWLSQVEHTVNVRTIAIGVVAVAALAAGIVAIVLARGTEHDAATDAEVQDVREQLAAVEQTANEAAKDDVQPLTERISALEDKIASVTQGDQSVDQQISVIKDDIQDIRDQISDLESGGTSTGTTTTTTTP